MKNCVAPCHVLFPRYLGSMTELQKNSETRDYTIPEGCPVCGADLPVRISASGPNGVCRHCHWIGRPTITMTHNGLEVGFDLFQA